MGQTGLFQFSIDNALEIIMGIDRLGRIVYANQKAMEQLEYGDELYDALITEIFPEAFRIEGGSLVLVDRVIGKLQETMAYRWNRTCFPAKMKLFESAGFAKEAVYICMAYDISNEFFLEKKVARVAQEAEDALKVKSEFVANVTHELRTPVNGILGNTQELIQQETEGEKMKLLRLVERGCRDMNAIINNILDFSKLEAGKFTLEPRKFHFRNMMDYIKGNHSNRIHEKGLDFTISISPEIPEYIVGDELRLVQILNNLISNAYKFTSVGEIHVDAVKTSHAGNRIELFFMVTDSGIGIAKADQTKLFQSFSQADASISRKYGGTGLGLNICKQLVELMGGNIHVDSEPGRGSIFSFGIWVELPEESVTAATNYTTGAGEQLLRNKLQVWSAGSEEDKTWQFGTVENKDEIEKKMSKLILCMEMDNWEKAEGFAETVKQLVESAPREVKSAALRLKMAVQKGDYEKAQAAFETLKEML